MRWFQKLILRPQITDPLLAQKQQRFALEMLPIIKKLQPLCFGSNTKIAGKLNGRQYRTIEGRHWTSTDVEQVLEIAASATPVK
jgi:hypothetical protein